MPTQPLTNLSRLPVNFLDIRWKWKWLSCVRLFATPCTIKFMEFSRPEYWSGWPLPSPGDLPNSGIKPRSPALHSDSLPAEPPGKPKNTGVGSLSLLPFSSGSSRARNRTGVSFIEDRFFTSWSTINTGKFIEWTAPEVAQGSVSDPGSLVFAKFFVRCC